MVPADAVWRPKSSRNRPKTILKRCMEGELSHVEVEKQCWTLGCRLRPATSGPIRRTCGTREGAGVYRRSKLHLRWRQAVGWARVRFARSPAEEKSRLFRNRGISRQFAHR